MSELRRIPFRVPMRVPVGGVTERRGWLVEGPAGWGEISPLPSWGAAEIALAERAGAEAATTPFPAPVRQSVEINAMVPRVAPDAAARLAAESGCRTIKVKVGDDQSSNRVAAIRAALPSARIRLDANGAWALDQAVAELAALAAYDIELVEDPVQSLEDLAALRRRSPVPVAAESCVRTVADAARLRAMEAADAIVIKPQRIGGIAAALDAAAEAGVPAIASSALETSVGLAAVLAVAAALPSSPFAHGIGTAQLLGADVVASPLVPINGLLTPGRVAPDESWVAEASA